jgi:hypothetical protein
MMMMMDFFLCTRTLGSDERATVSLSIRSIFNFANERVAAGVRASQWRSHRHHHSSSISFPQTFAVVRSGGGASSETVG